MVHILAVEKWWPTQRLWPSKSSIMKRPLHASPKVMVVVSCQFYSTVLKVSGREGFQCKMARVRDSWQLYCLATWMKQFRCITGYWWDKCWWYGVTCDATYPGIYLLTAPLKSKLPPLILFLSRINELKVTRSSVKFQIHKRHISFLSQWFSRETRCILQDISNLLLRGTVLFPTRNVF